MHTCTRFLIEFIGFTKNIPKLFTTVLEAYLFNRRICSLVFVFHKSENVQYTNISLCKNEKLVIDMLARNLYIKLIFIVKF